jgi:PAS domain S-box-containing protein
MISNSMPLMTAIDLLIIAVTVYGIWRCQLISPGKRLERPRISLLLINLGLLAVALFYAADLAIMHLLPMVTPIDEAMKAMEALHRNVSWLVILFAVVFISIGFIELLVELQRREARVRRLVDANIIGVFIWGADGRIVDANEAFLHITGYSRDDLVSKRPGWTELTPADTRSVDEQRLAELKVSGAVHPYETEYIQGNSGRVPVLVGMAMFEGTKEGVAFVLDLSERKRAEAEARENERRYRETQMELAHANRVAMMGQLTASIAHEINQPIGAAIIYANAALSWLRAQPPDWEEVQQALGFIVESGVRAGEVIDRIRTLVKKAQPQKDKVQINEAILEVLALIRAEIATNAVSAKTQLAEGLPSVWGDRVQLQQVMLNLFINAIEAMSGMDEGSRQLLISTEKIRSDAVLVAVRDSGPGFPPESAERLFESFYTTKPGGLGMGLSICHSIIEAHEGRLSATANLPRGAVFQFTLPAFPAGGDPSAHRGQGRGRPLV